jgi:hypothetical protein
MKKIGKSLFPIFFVLLLTIGAVKGQKNTAGAGLHEIGAGLAGLNYTGDVSPNYNFRNYRPGLLLFYRFNISPVVNFRLAFVGGSLYGDESNSLDPIPYARKAKFSTQLTEFAACVEYNFFNYRPKKEVYRFSPYLTAGLCFFNSKTAGGAQIGVPMGMGIKYRASRRINLGFELVARKTFTDKLDGVDSYYIGVHQTANPNTNDWYYVTAITLSYTVYSVVCPDTFNR